MCLAFSICIGILATPDFKYVPAAVAASVICALLGIDLYPLYPFLTPVSINLTAPCVAPAATAIGAPTIVPIEEPNAGAPTSEPTYAPVPDAPLTVVSIVPLILLF